MKNKKILWAAAIALIVGLLTTMAHHFMVLEKLENASYDWRVQRFRSGKKAHDSIAIILIDENSLSVLNPIVGRWPWPRSLYNDLLGFLAMGGAKAVLFDVLFVENERSSGPAQTDGLSSNDFALVTATGESGAVYHAAQLLRDTEDEFNKGLLHNPLPQDFIERFALKNVTRPSSRPSKNNTYYLPFRELYLASKGIGIVEFPPDSDGVYRRTSLLREYQGHFFPVLSTAPLFNSLSIQSVIEEKERYVFLTGEGKIDIPKTGDGNYLINFYDWYNTYSISGVLASMQMITTGEIEGPLPVDPEEFRDKIVLIGASAVGVEDLKSTSMSSKMPGVELHASIVSNILQRDFLQVKKRETTIFYIFLVSITICFMVIFLTPAAKVIVPFLFFTLLLAWWIFQFKQNIVYSITPPFVAAIASWISSFAYLSLTEGKDKRKVKKMLSQYVSPALLDEVMKDYNGVLKATVGSKENLTVLFSDIRGFTNISEKLPPEAVVELLNEYLSAMSDVIFQYKGTLDKFIGDAILAFWGAPIRTETHALQAVEAAVDMTRALHAVNEIFEKKGTERLNIGIGINTGEVILGNIGSEKKLDYTVIGDNVNLASRLEGLTKVYKARVLLSESTYDAMEGQVPCRLIDMVQVKGKKHPVKIYGVLCKSTDSAELVRSKRILETLSGEAFNFYLKREWQEAIKCYNKLIEINPGDVVSKRFVELCAGYIKNEPGDEWNGVAVFTTK